MLQDLITATGLVANATTAGPGEETVPLSKDGAVAAATVPVPAGTTLVVSDMILSGVFNADWRLQKTDNGVDWTDVIVARSVLNDLVNVPIETPPKIVGGANVEVRLRAQTDSGTGGGDVFAVIRGFEQP